MQSCVITHVQVDNVGDETPITYTSVSCPDAQPNESVPCEVRVESADSTVPQGTVTATPGTGSCTLVDGSCTVDVPSGSNWGTTVYVTAKFADHSPTPPFYDPSTGKTTFGVSQG